MRQPAIASLLLLLLLPGYAVGQQEPTLADVLEQNSIFPDGNVVPHLNDTITSYGTLNTDREFLIAYYLVTSPNELHFPLFVTQYDKRSGKWQHASLTNLELIEGTQNPLPCIGSVVGLHSNGDWNYVDLHLTPSAACLVVLNHDLTVHETLTGWTVASFKSGLLAYEGNMIHFAPVHPATLFLYDPAANTTQKIYPQNSDPFRKDFSRRLRKAIKGRPCPENDWPCDPQRFESSIDSVEVNDRTHSLAVLINFGTPGFLSREEAEDSGKWDDDQYVYIYQLEPFRWREFSIYDLKPKFGTDSLKELLTPKKLRRVFATPPPH